MLELLYHKRNPTITVVADGSIFWKILRLYLVLTDEIVINIKTPVLYGWKAFWIIFHRK